MLHRPALNLELTFYDTVSLDLTTLFPSNFDHNDMIVKSLNLRFGIPVHEHVVNPQSNFAQYNLTDCREYERKICPNV